MKPALTIQDLRASVGETEILKGLDLEVPFGEIHAVVGGVLVFAVYLDGLYRRAQT